MAYNLPNAWDPGFVLPDNVEDEGLERRGFVTKQMPRGSYDNPAVGTGGMVVPQYVSDEGYGQGTFTTKWQSSGTYSGPRIPHWLNQRPQVVREKKLPGGGRVVTVQALGDDDAPMPTPFETYGQKAAQALISRVATLPPGRRQQAMRSIMDQVDKSLWKRTGDITRRYATQGVPVAQAFPVALARALSTGIAAELIDTGLRRAAPQAQSLLGLGCYGPQALGVISRGTSDGPIMDRPPPRPPVDTRTDAEKAAALASSIQIAQQTEADLASGKAYLDNGVVKYHVGTSWLDQVVNAVAGAVTTVVTGTAGGVATAATTAGGAVAATGGAIGGGVASVAGGLASAVASGAKVIYDVAGMPVRWTIDAAGAVYDAGGAVIGWIKDASGAIYDAGGAVIGWVKDVVVAVGEAVGDGLKKLGDLACDLLKTPGVGAAAGAAGAAVAGVPPQAGAQAGQVGAQIAQGACGTPPPPVVPPPGTSILPLAIMGGMAVLGAFLLFGGKSRPHQTKTTKTTPP